MSKKTFIINGNLSFIQFHEILRFTRAKVTKFVFVPDNITNTNAICVNISQMSNNNIVNTDGGYVSYFFLIPFVNNNSAPNISSDVNDTWDYSGDNRIELNRFIVSITNEEGVLLTFNNSTLIMELLFE